jgi:hypothetical protein
MGDLESHADVIGDAIVGTYGAFPGSSAVGRAGLEPATLGLKVPCSTN